MMKPRLAFFTEFRRPVSVVIPAGGSRSPVAVAEPPPVATASTASFAEPAPEEIERAVHAEIAAIWGVPLGFRAEVTLRDHALVKAMGRLELHRMPERPFSAERLLVLRIDQDMFTNRQIESWTLME